MRALCVRALGNADQLKVEDLPAPVAGPGRVLVRVNASALNPADLKVVNGEFAGRFLHARKFPLVVGYDLAGTVEAVGDGVQGLAPGDRVHGFLPFGPGTDQGAFAELAAPRADEVGRVPASVGDEAAAAVATAGITALLALRDRAGMKPGGRVAVLGAAGGVGSLAIGVARKLGASVTAVCSASAEDFVRSLGPDEVAVRGHGEPLRLEGNFDCVFDTPGAYGYRACRAALGPGGAYVSTLPTASVIGGKLLALFSSRRSLMVMTRSRRADLELLTGWIAEGMQVQIDSRFPVREGAGAMARLARGGMRGRLAIDVAGGW
jgi:NADPH:quinone reductase-like Zn-dependent oxidoreductase